MLQGATVVPQSPNSGRDEMEETPTSDQETIDSDRRDVLRNSVYAAYATPLITILLVDAQSAAASSAVRCSPEWCSRPGNRHADCCR